MKELVSVVIPCYNVEKFISECLDGFMSQTWNNIEVICVDDGSTDHTAEIILDYCEKDSRIRLIKQKNLYAGVARNNGLSCANGDYIFFFDGDDFCEKETIEELVNSSRRCDADIAVCDMRHYDNVSGQYINTAGFLRTSYLREFEDLGYINSSIIPDYILMFAFSGPTNKLYRKDFLDKTGLLFQDSRRDNDEYFVLTSLAVAERISWVEKKLVTYRINNPWSLQGFGEKDIDMDDILSTTRALKNGLEKYGKFELVQHSFRNQVLMRYIGLLEGQRSIENYIKVYNTIKDVVFPEFGIDRMQEDTIIAKAEERHCILMYDSNEYLFYKMKKFQNSYGEAYVLPWSEIKDVKKIGLYCAGTVGKSYYRQLNKSTLYNVVGWYDSNAKKLKSVIPNILSPDKANPSDMDKILIAIEEKKIYKEIRKELLLKGFSENQIVWRV